MGTVLPELRATMVPLRESLWSQLHVLEADLRKVPLPQSLLMDLCKAESKWSEIKKCYGTILAVSEGEQVQKERVAHAEFRVHYFNVNDQVQGAIDDNQSKEEARVLKQSKVFEAHALGDRWKCAYTDIDASLDEIMVQLDGGPTISVRQLEVINIKFDG